MATQFNSAEWRKIRETLDRDRARYGLPEREYGSVLLASFNIRKLGSARSRSPETWQFLAEVCRSFDLMAVQEIMDDLSGLRRLMSLLGPEFSLIVSDQTGVFPGEPGVGERLGFIYRWSVVERMEVVTDISYDRTKVLDTIAHDYAEFSSALEPYASKLKAYEEGRSRRKPRLKLPMFLTFIRQPFCVSFRIAGHPGTQPYQFMAVNAHLYFGQYISDRRQEFDALMEWIIGRVKADHRAYYPNFILLGDLNLDFDAPTTDRDRIERHLKSFNNASGEEVNVYLPFLDAHPKRTKPFRTNARLSETFDQICLFSRDARLPTFEDNGSMGRDPRGPDYGVFEFVNLFSEALLQAPFESLERSDRADFIARFEHKVSDHMPLWMRLTLP
ncbi:MAG: endonuclease/exonuclease/phosphatase [Chloroflexi bacterium]|nr:endonuclease/exonuclease/phosphatase [Chloroflexota bacterium]